MPASVLPASLLAQLDQLSLSPNNTHHPMPCRRAASSRNNLAMIEHDKRRKAAAAIPKSTLISPLIPPEVRAVHAPLHTQGLNLLFTHPHSTARGISSPFRPVFAFPKLAISTHFRPEIENLIVRRRRQNDLSRPCCCVLLCPARLRSAWRSSHARRCYRNSVRRRGARWRVLGSPDTRHIDRQRTHQCDESQKRFDVHPSISLKGD